jgi:DNA-directed RNA polymerase subunit RPC12/RpoP
MRVLERNSELRDWTADEIACAFAIAEAKVLSKRKKKTAFHTLDGEEYFFVSMPKPEFMVRWRCAYCTKSIIARINDTGSLACKRCSHRIATNEGPLISSFVDFMSHCKTAMMRRKRYILKYIRKNRRPNQ